MSNTLRPCILGLVASSAYSLWAPLAAQSAGTEADPIDVCALVTHDEVKKLSQDTLARFWTEPEATMVAGGSGCDYSGGHIRLYSGSTSEASWNGALKAWKQDAQPRTPLTGIGERAYLMYNKPRDQYEGKYAIVGSKVGQHTVVVALARLVVAKLQ